MPDKWNNEAALWTLERETTTLAYPFLDILTKLEAFNWDSRLFLKSHNLNQLKALESNKSIEKLQVMMRHGKNNITINRYK